MWTLQDANRYQDFETLKIQNSTLSFVSYNLGDDIGNLILENNSIVDLADGSLSDLNVYSQNSASSLLNFIKIYQTENLWMNTNLMCIGEKTSTILNEIKWKKIFFFNTGEEEYLLYKI